MADDHVEGEPEVKMIDWYFNEGAYEPDEDGYHEMNPAETREYYERITKSDGFDAPYFPKCIVFGNIAPITLASYAGVEAYDCAKFALEEHNKAEGKKYVFHEVLKANMAAAAGASFYITFDAEDPDVVEEKIGLSEEVRTSQDGLRLVIFEAEVFHHLPDKNRV